MRRLVSLDFDLEGYEGNEAPQVEKVWQAIQEFQHYITVNEPFISRKQAGRRASMAIPTLYHCQ
jgi:hypothetical protein